MQKLKKTILMVAINSSWSQSTLAFYYLKEVIMGLPYNTTIQSWVLKDHDILQGIFGKSPDIVCFSAYIWNRQSLEQLIPDVKKLLPQAIIVVGGPEAENLQAILGLKDFCIVGAGEAKFRSLAESGFALAQAQVPEIIPLSRLPFPYAPDDTPSLTGKLVYYECYRGCPYSCVYCLSAKDKRKELRFDIDNTEDKQRLTTELERLKAIKPKTLKFVDRSFNLHPELSRFIWQYFISTGSPCDVHFEIYPDLLQEEDIALLATAPEGLIRFEIGIQTTNTAVTAACGRFTSWEKAKQALLALKSRTKVRIHTDLIAGLPGENFASVLESIDQLCSTLPDAVQLGTLKILPDTPMQAIAQERGYLWQNYPPYQTLASDALSYTEMCLLESLARVLNLYWNKEEFADNWRIMLQKYPATEVLFAFLKYHETHGYELHSLAKAKRAVVMAEIYSVYGD